MYNLGRRISKIQAWFFFPYSNRYNVENKCTSYTIWCVYYVIMYNTYACVCRWVAILLHTNSGPLFKIDPDTGFKFQAQVQTKPTSLSKFLFLIFAWVIHMGSDLADPNFSGRFNLAWNWTKNVKRSPGIKETFHLRCLPHATNPWESRVCFYHTIILYGIICLF